MDEDDLDYGIDREISEDKHTEQYLVQLFGQDVTSQANLIDTAELNITDEMTQVIAQGLKQLKQLKNTPDQQQSWIQSQPYGTQLLLCLWVKDMGLINKILADQTK